MDETPKPNGLPVEGTAAEDVIAELSRLKEGDADWRAGRTGAYVFWASDELLAVAKEASALYFSENALSPKAFPSVHELERRTLAIVANLLRGDGAVGNMTSGGTESILLAVKVARDKARHERGVERPQMVLPVSAHPAFNKAAQYFGVEAIRTPLNDDFKADVAAMESAISDDCVLLVGSAPQYPHGVIDPIPRIGKLAASRNLPLHVDACVGGLFLPFLRQLRDGIEDFDFSVPGVTSMSADLHKFGFTAKGASAVLYRDPEMHAYQTFSFTGWPIGQYASPTMRGTRPAGPIAAAWAVLNHLGEEGYLELNRTIMRVTERFWSGIDAIPRLQVWGEPVMGCFGYGSTELDMSAVAVGMEQRGWFINRQSDPPGIHMFVTPAHAAAVESYLSDLSTVAEEVHAGRIQGDGVAAYYG